MKEFRSLLSLVVCLSLVPSLVAHPAWAQGAPASASASASAPGVAQPPASSPDTIFLKGGGILRGTLVDAIPNQHARIRLTTGELATVLWNQIERIEQLRRVEQPSIAPTQTAATPPVGPKVFVHMEGSNSAVVEARSLVTLSGWDEVCAAPCDRLLPTEGYEYRISGSGVRLSRVFRLAGADNDRLLLDISTGSKGWFVLGIIGTSIAGVTTLVAMIAALGSRTAEGRATGLGVAGVAGLLTAGSIAAVASNGSTDVGIRRAEKTQALPPVREAEWHAPVEPVERGSAWTFPVLGGTF